MFNFSFDFAKPWYARRLGALGCGGDCSCKACSGVNGLGALAGEDCTWLANSRDAFTRLAAKSGKKASTRASAQQQADMYAQNYIDCMARNAAAVAAAAAPPPPPVPVAPPPPVAISQPAVNYPASSGGGGGYPAFYQMPTDPNAGLPPSGSSSPYTMAPQTPIPSQPYQPYLQDMDEILGTGASGPGYGAPQPIRAPQTQMTAVPVSSGGVLDESDPNFSHSFPIEYSDQWGPMTVNSIVLGAATQAAGAPGGDAFGAVVSSRQVEAEEIGLEGLGTLGRYTGVARSIH